MTKLTRMVNVRLDQQVVDRLFQRAAAEELQLSDIIRRAIRRELKTPVEDDTAAIVEGRD